MYFVGEAEQIENEKIGYYNYHEMPAWLDFPWDPRPTKKIIKGKRGYTAIFNYIKNDYAKPKLKITCFFAEFFLNLMSLLFLWISNVCDWPLKAQD